MTRVLEKDRLAANLDRLKGRIAAAAERAGRSPEGISLVAVTKTVGIPEVQTLYELGVREFGENRLQAAQPKIEALGSAYTWHMIGPIQSRKTRDVATFFDYADAVDRWKVLSLLDEQCAAAEKRMPVLLEVNVSGEESKHGFKPDEVGDVLARSQTLENIMIKGLMTMAPLVEDTERVRPVFTRLRELAQELQLDTLSMGMSNDFEVAIEEGATQIRVGSLLFA